MGVNSQHFEISFTCCWVLQLGAAVAEWLSSWLAEQEVRGSIPGLATWISEIGYLLLPSRDMTEIPLKRRKSPIQPTKPSNQPVAVYIALILMEDVAICIYLYVYLCPRRYA